MSLFSRKAFDLKMSFVEEYMKRVRFPYGSDSKESACNVGDPGLIPGLGFQGLGRSPGEGNGNPLQYFCLESSRDRGAWRATVHGVTKS